MNILTPLATKYNGVFNYMVEFLCFTDRYSLCLSHPGYKKSIYPKHLNFSHIVKKHLTRIGLDAEAWFHHLKMNKNLMTGSFILWCMFEDRSWEYNDIDIVGIYIQNDPFLYWLLESHGTLVEEKDRYEGDGIQLPVPCLLWNYDDYNHHMKWMPEDKTFNVIRPERYGQYASVYMNKEGKQYKFKQKKVELQNRQYPHTLPIVSRTYQFDICDIPINHIHYCNKKNTNPFTYISQFFDVNFCKVAFDGEHLYVYNWNDIINKSSHVSWEHYLEIHTPYYQGPHPPLQDTIGYSYQKSREAWFLLRLQHRQERYKNRGFNVHIEGADKVDLTYKDSVYKPHILDYQVIQRTLSTTVLRSYEDRYVL